MAVVSVQTTRPRRFRLIMQTVNWYRTREINFQEELLCDVLYAHPISDLANDCRLDKVIIEIPTLFIQASKDAALPPDMSVGMEKHFPRLTRREVQTSHWALWERPEQVNNIIEQWLCIVALGGGRSSL